MSKPKLLKLSIIAQLWWIGFRNPQLRKAGWAAKVPTQPGRYIDKSGDLWTLTDDGRWVDKHNSYGPRFLHWVVFSWGLVKVAGDE